MQLQLNIARLQKPVVKPMMIIAVGYLAILAIALNNYLEFLSLSFILGILALYFVWIGRQKEKRHYRYGIWTIMFLVLTVLMPVKTLLFFTIGFALLFLAETVYGRLSLLAPFVLVLISPIFQYAVNTFSFPIRLGLTKLAGQIFSIAGIDTVVKGNVIVHGGNEFTIDPGCMGLNMIESSLLLGAILGAYYIWQYNRKSNLLLLSSYFIVLVLLTVLANLFRIILLVQFAIMPGTIGHEAAGIACILLYVFIPATYLASLFVTRWGKQHVLQTTKSRVSKKWLISLHTVLLISTIGLAWLVYNADTYKKVDISVIKAGSGLSASVYAPGIVKIKHNESLIYIKYLRGFYDSDHNPMLCWKGSGYEFEQVVPQTINGRTIYTGVLFNGNEKLYSAWWYSNGKSITTDQLKWRWDMIKRPSNYALVNITCNSSEQLNAAVKKAINEKQLALFFSDAFYH